jgi:hypothetical protein
VRRLGSLPRLPLDSQVCHRLVVAFRGWHTVADDEPDRV